MIKENLVRLFESSIKNNWELDAFTDYISKETLTYGEVGIEVEKLHLLFKKTGLHQGDKVSLIGQNGANWCIVYIATITYGAVIVPILQDFNSDDIHHVINHSESKLLFITDSIWEHLEETKITDIQTVFSLNNFECLHKTDKNEKVIPCADIEKAFNAQYPNGLTAADVLYPTIPNSELACLSYTSGTTGFSKGVMLSGNNLAGNITFGIGTKLLQAGDRTLAFLPLAHSYGCAFDFLTSFCVGAHTTFLGKLPSPKILLKAFEEVKPTCIFTVPLVIEKIYRQQIIPILNNRSMRIAMNIPIIENRISAAIRKKLTEAMGNEFKEVIVGGAPISHEAEAFFKKIGFRFTVGYGMTECAPLISYIPWTEFKIGTVGKALPTMEVKIDSADQAHKVGEIMVKGENVMMGYYKNEEATKTVLETDGWMHTGDMGTIDNEGNIYIRGRNKTMLLSANGQNIYPEEIESKLNNMPFVMESIVVESANNKLVALVYPDQEALDSAKLSKEDVEAIMEENRKNLNAITASYESISKIQLYPKEFEKTPKKSIKRYLYANLLK